MDIGVYDYSVYISLAVIYFKHVLKIGFQSSSTRNYCVSNGLVFEWRNRPELAYNRV